MGCMTRIVTADEFRANWPRLLSQLAEGEELLLTDAGRPIGRVLPPLPAERPLAHDEWKQEHDAWQRDAQGRVGRYPPGFALDASYEAIYGEREDAQR
jgi:antitoxin (DNA-binding transcriptional repressor) of toxin-antitoxin stability system